MFFNLTSLSTVNKKSGDQNVTRLFCLALLCALFVKAEIVLNPEPPMTLENIQYTPFSSKMEVPTIKYFISFINQTQFNPDQRLMELGYLHGAFVNLRNQDKITHQMYLSTENVIVYYKNAPPQIGSSIRTYGSGSFNSYFKEGPLTQHLNKVFGEEDFENLNTFPMFEIGPDEPTVANQLINVGSDLKDEMDPLDSDEYMTTYNVNLPNDLIANYLAEIVSMWFDFIYSGDEEVLVGDRVVEEFEQSFEEQKMPFVQQQVQKIMQSEESMLKVSALFEGMLYFSHKLMRKFYFENTRYVFTQLFSKFDDSSSTYSDLFEEDSISFDQDLVFRKEKYENLKKEPILDSQDMMHLKMVKQHDVNKIYFNGKISGVLDRFSEIIGLISEDTEALMTGLDSEHQLPENPRFSNDIFFFVMDIYHKHFKEEIFRPYAKRLKESLPKLEVFEDMDIDDLNEASPQQLNLFRKALTIVGQVFFLPGQIPYNMVNVRVPFFLMNGRRNLII